MSRAQPSPQPAPSLEDLPLIRLLREVTVESDQFAQRFSVLHKLHRTDLNALVHVMDAERRAEPISPSDLARRLGLSMSATTAVIDRLEASEHLVRGRSSQDRRRVSLHMADNAFDLAQKFFGPLGAEFSRAWRDFTHDERRVISRFLQVSVDAMVDLRHSWDE